MHSNGATERPILIPWLDRNTPFPPAETALHDPNGLLAAGADLSPERLLSAYRQGIFPWFSEGEPILWWCPDPRMVLYPQQLKVARSLRKVLRNAAYEIRFDTAFEEVIAACAAPRDGQRGTWITSQMQGAYCALHRLGYAHSAETWIEGELAGGLYGVAVGGIFFGESMFTRVRDASKIAFVCTVRRLQEDGFQLVDCQFHTEHLETLGARPIPRADFLRQVRELVHNSRSIGNWSHAGFNNQPCRN
jgi:leucyl/phenylalanyl-tRNA--protein transferase